MDNDSTTNLASRLQGRDARAAEMLFKRYSQRVAALVRTRVAGKLSRRLDADDVVQSVFRVFFSGVQEGRYHFARGGDLWRLLATIARNKLCELAKQNARQKRAVGREQGFGSEESWLRIAGHPTSTSPVLEMAALDDTLNQIMRRLDPRQVQILELRLQGCSIPEIAAETHRSERTVFRVLKDIKEHLERTSGGTPGGETGGGAA